MSTEALSVVCKQNVDLSIIFKHTNLYTAYHKILVGTNFGNLAK